MFLNMFEFPSIEADCECQGCWSLEFQKLFWLNLRYFCLDIEAVSKITLCSLTSSYALAVILVAVKQKNLASFPKPSSRFLGLSLLTYTGLFHTGELCILQSSACIFALLSQHKN